MNYKLLVGIPVAMLTVGILLKSPEYWWLLLAIPLAFLKKKMNSIKNSAGNSIYDEEYERIFASPPTDDNRITTVIETNNDRKRP